MGEGTVERVTAADIPGAFGDGSGDSGYFVYDDGSGYDGSGFGDLGYYDDGSGWDDAFGYDDGSGFDFDNGDGPGDRYYGSGFDSDDYGLADGSGFGPGLADAAFDAWLLFFPAGHLPRLA